MRRADWRRRMGGVTAVAAAFWLGFLCGGGGSSSGAAAIRTTAEARQQDPPPASRSPEESGQQDPAPGPDAPQESGQQDPAPGPDAPQESPPVTEEVPDAVAEESSEADPAMDAPSGLEGEADEATDAPPGPEPPLVQDRPREFTADTGVMLNFVAPGGESAFEDTLRRVAEALTASDSEERRRQAEGWRTYRAEEPLADGVLLYISWFDPAVPGADYWIPAILNEAFPTEAQSLYDTYAGAFADGQILLNLTPVAGP